MYAWACLVPRHRYVDRYMLITLTIVFRLFVNFPISWLEPKICNFSVEYSKFWVTSLLSYTIDIPYEALIPCTRVKMSRDWPFEKKCWKICLKHKLQTDYDWFCNLDIEPKNMWRRDDMETYSSFTESSKAESAGHSDYTTHKCPVIRLTTRKISKLSIISL